MSKIFSKNYYTKNDFPLLRTELDNLKLSSIQLTSWIDSEAKDITGTAIVKYFKKIRNREVEVIAIFQCDRHVFCWLSDTYYKFRKDYHSTYVKKEIIQTYDELPF